MTSAKAAVQVLISTATEALDCTDTGWDDGTRLEQRRQLAQACILARKECLAAAAAIAPIEVDTSTRWETAAKEVIRIWPGYNAKRDKWEVWWSDRKPKLIALGKEMKNATQRAWKMRMEDHRAHRVSLLHKRDYSVFLNARV